MNFSEKLSEYMELLDCNTNELCEESGLSYMLINRYINTYFITKICVLNVVNVQVCAQRVQ